MRVIISKRGHSTQGSMIRVEVRSIGKWKPELLSADAIFNCPVILTVLAPSEKEAFSSARITAKEEGWTIVTLER